ncbi:MAG: Spy/CpxP family protein refolding chaperone [Blastocatellia bacterium]
MRTINFWLTGLVALMVAVLLAVGADAQGVRPRGQRGAEAQQFFRDLDLTEEQRAQMRSLREQSREESQPILRQLRDLQKERRQLIQSNTFNEEAARSLVNRESELRSALSLNRTASQHAVYNLLTPEQKAKLADRAAKAAETRAQRTTGERPAGSPRGGRPRRW